MANKEYALARSWLMAHGCWDRVKHLATERSDTTIAEVIRYYWQHLNQVPETD